MSLELSPGFFDPRIALSDDDEEDIIPKNINIEKMDKTAPPKENVVISFVKFIILNARKEDCGCDGWKRTYTY
ncbi:hypothetical protein PBCVCvsA1_597L [Paramecium bursaria Chlorella virus CvsA1]|nr:hypothetical protein PBCVCviKI_580L [Paramecium bursaria Chlorella virus CviKI]AGE52635.1 hypothetical protein PBCVCvsA1_597L [Paramecium bursaria Chlorella virus CvsA1]AGE55427.1 hypothetical protein PBCVMA1E_688L [Paramecium bursaria Chlorella virus MA1E]